MFHDRTTARAFIVEHDVDKALLEQFVHHPVFTTHKWLDTEDSRANARPLATLFRLAISAALVTGEPRVLKAAQNLPDDRHLIIAG